MENFNFSASLRYQVESPNWIQKQTDAADP